MFWNWFLCFLYIEFNEKNNIGSLRKKKFRWSIFFKYSNIKNWKFNKIEFSIWQNFFFGEKNLEKNKKLF